MGGSWNLQFLVSLPYRCYIPNLDMIGPVVIEKKMLTHDGRHQPIAIGHLSHSGDLKMCAVLHFCIPSGWKSLQACIYVYLFNCHENLQICRLYCSILRNNLEFLIDFWTEDFALFTQDTISLSSNLEKSKPIDLYINYIAISPFNVLINTSSCTFMYKYLCHLLNHVRWS